jgi:protein-tyrosine-phosphatase
MKILFVCRGNVGRSQIAMEFYKKFTRLDADSAGTIVDENENQMIKEIPSADVVVRLMKNYGIDVSENKRKQLTENMVENFDKIIMMAEPETIPDYLKNNPKIEIWEIQDPKDMNDIDTQKIISQIKSKVLEFIRKNKIQKVV